MAFSGVELKSGWPKVGEIRWMGLKAERALVPVLYCEIMQTSLTTVILLAVTIQVITCSGGRCRHGSGPAGDDRSQSQIMARRWYSDQRYRSHYFGHTSVT